MSLLGSFSFAMREVRLFLVGRQALLRELVPAFDVLIALRRRQQIRFAGLRRLQIPRVKRLVAEPDGISIETTAGSGLAGTQTSVTKEHRDYIVRLPRLDPTGNRQLAPAMLQLDDVGVLPSFNSELLRGVWTHPRRSVPCELRQRLWQLLQPAVVREAPVVDMRITTDDEFITLY